MIIYWDTNLSSAGHLSFSPIIVQHYHRDGIFPFTYRATSRTKSEWVLLWYRFYRLQIPQYLHICIRMGDKSGKGLGRWRSIADKHYSETLLLLRISILSCHVQRSMTNRPFQNNISTRIVFQGAVTYL